MKRKPALYSFSLEPNNWTLADDERFMLTYIEAVGNNVDEMMENAIISISDWNGNEARENWSIDDLRSKDYDSILRLIETFIAQKARKTP